MQRSEQVSSAENVLRLLVELSERGRLRVAEAADLLGVTPPTAHRLLSTLKRHEFADQDRQRAYVPGARLAQLRRGPGAPPSLNTVSHPLLVELSERTGETSHLVTLQGNGARFVDGAEGARLPRVRKRVGLLLPAHTISGGKVLLAHLADVQLLALFPDGRVRLRDETIVDLAHLRRELSTVRHQGHALSLGGTERAVNAIGVPVVVDSHRVVAAVVIGVPASRSGKADLVGHLPAMRECAEGVARKLS